MTQHGQAARLSPLTAEVVRHQGTLKIRIRDTVYDPLAFRSFRAEPRNVRDFYQAGVRLMSILHSGLNCTLDVPYSRYGEIWEGPGQYNFATIDRQMEVFLNEAPDACFNIMLQLDTRDWYLKAHPEASNTFRNLVEMAGESTWREITTRYLRDMLHYFESKYGDRVFAYTLFCGGSTEWYTNSQSSKADAVIRPHPLKEASYRRFTGDPEARLIPLDVLHRTSHGVFRDPVEDADARHYWRFHHGIIADAILFFAKQAQEVLQHRKLLGLFYGYLVQLGGKRLLEEGQLAYEPVWNSPDIDMIFAPAKYGAPREFEGASGFLATVDSIGLRDKLFFQEIDHRTHVAPPTAENGRPYPGSDNCLRDEFQSRMVLRREFAMTRIKQTGLWWFDFFGGFYYDPALMDEVAKMVRIQQRLHDIPLRTVAEIAVFADPESMYDVQAFSPLATDLLVRPPDELNRLGAPYDLYTFSDLEHDQLPLGQYRLIIFLNAFRISAKTQRFIETKVKSDGRSVLWFYAPGYPHDDGFSVEAIQATTGIGVKRRMVEDSEVVVAPSGFFGRLPAGLHYGFSAPVAPLFEISDSEAAIHACYRADGAPALASKELATHTAWYSAVGNLPAAIYREIARRAGVHIYYEGGDPVYINNRLLSIHMQDDPAPVIHLPGGRARQAEELFDGGTLILDEGSLVIPRESGATKLFLLSP